MPRNSPEQEGGAKKEEARWKPVFTFLTRWVSDAGLSRRDSGSFMAFTACRASARETETNSLLIGSERLLPTVGQREKSATREIDGS